MKFFLSNFLRGYAATFLLVGVLGSSLPSCDGARDVQYSAVGVVVLSSEAHQ